jgi:hypothetical protein
MVTMGDLGAAAFDYKGATCDALGARIDRLKANMASHPARAKDPRYQTNLKNFTGEYDSRCGGSLNPNAVGAFANAYLPIHSTPPGMIDTFTANQPLANALLAQQPVQVVQTPNGPVAVPTSALGEEPFYKQTWFLVAAGLGIAAVAFGVIKLRKRAH